MSRHLSCADAAKWSATRGIACGADRVRRSYVLSVRDLHRNGVSIASTASKYDYQLVNRVDNARAEWCRDRVVAGAVCAGSVAGAIVT